MYLIDYFCVAIRSGDYYMFDDIENEELDIFEDIAKDSDDEDMRETTSRTHITVGEVGLPFFEFGSSL